ncbi:hypothetical protein SUGI_0371970 [Cryptomeria japonica]|nr:hypothetical protein SUGI_0371970 [Cryptomeria japonica]
MPIFYYPIFSTISGVGRYPARSQFKNLKTCPTNKRIARFFKPKICRSRIGVQEGCMETRVSDFYKSVAWAYEDLQQSIKIGKQSESTSLSKGVGVEV